MKIKSTDNKGIHLICSDGTVFSLQFGAGNYCQNYSKSILNQYADKPDTESSDCEVAVIKHNGDWITKHFFREADDGEVAGHIPIQQAISQALNYEKKIKDLK